MLLILQWKVIDTTAKVPSAHHDGDGGPEQLPKIGKTAIYFTTDHQVPSSCFLLTVIMKFSRDYQRHIAFLKS